MDNATPDGTALSADPTGANPRRAGVASSALMGLGVGVASYVFGWLEVRLWAYSGAHLSVWIGGLAVAVLPLLMLSVAYLLARVFRRLRPRQAWMFGVAVPIAAAACIVIGTQMNIFVRAAPALFVFVFYVSGDWESLAQRVEQRHRADGER